MPIRFEEYGPQHVDAVRAFNRRVHDSLDPELLFPETPGDWWLPKGQHPEIYQEAFVALEDDAVRGGYFLKHQPFMIAGENRRVACYRLPVSEGVADRKYASVALHLIRDAQARQPLLFSLGMGSLESPIAKLEKAAGWSQHVAPFQFRVLNGGRFLRHISALRATPVRRIVANAAAWTGAGALAFAMLRAARPCRVPNGISIHPFENVDVWADDLWAKCRDRYSLIAVRDSTIAAALYPASDARFFRWKVSAGSRVLGWAVALDTQMQAHRQFGDLRVATIVDGMADPADAPVLLAAVTRELECRGADLIISNQSNAAWSAGLKACGFMSGPSNFIFSASRKLAELIAPFPQRILQSHINRGDADGPIHL